MATATKKTTAKKSTIKKLVNNVIFVIDESGSMGFHTAKVDKIIADLSTPLQNAPQETRVSLYTFNSRVHRHMFRDVPAELRNFRLRPSGSTALIDCTIQAINDHARTRELASEDNSYLVYVITDGEENASRYRVTDLQKILAGLPDAWTVATLVPHVRSVHAAKMAGFAPGNIEVWDTTSANGFEEVGVRLTNSYNDYTTMRSSGVVGTRTLFTNAANLTKQEVKQVLVEDTSAKLIAIQKAGVIKDIVEEKTGRPYQPGTVFYELTKSELVQFHKELAVVSKTDGKRYFGPQARQILGLPSTECRVRPGDHGNWRIFVQSTSLNRKLLGGTSILVR